MRKFLDLYWWQPESPRLVLWGKQSPRDGYFQFGFSYNPCPKWRHTQGHLSFLLRTSQDTPQKKPGGNLESGKPKFPFRCRCSIWDTLPKTNIGPENWWLEYYFPLGAKGLCSGANSLLVSGRVCVWCLAQTHNALQLYCNHSSHHLWKSCFGPLQQWHGCSLNMPPPHLETEFDNLAENKPTNIKTTRQSPKASCDFWHKKTFRILTDCLQLSPVFCVNLV